MCLKRYFCFTFNAIAIEVKYSYHCNNNLIIIYNVEKKAFFSKGKYRKFTKRWQDYLHLVEAIN